MGIYTDITAKMGKASGLTAQAGIGSGLTSQAGQGSGLTAAMGPEGSAPSAYGTEYQAVYDAYSTAPDDADATIDDTMVTGLVDDGVWAKLDAFWVFANHVTGADSLRDWCTPANTATAYNSPAFGQWEGYAGNGSNAYIDLNFNLSTDSVNYVQDSASMGVYIRNNVTEARSDMAAIDLAPVRQCLIWARYSNKSYVSVNSSTYSQVASADSRGMWIANRVLSTHQDLYRNKSRIINGAGTSTGIPNEKLYALAQNYNGSANLFNTKQASLIFIGSGLTQTDINNITDRFETRMDAHSTGVIS
jgi:hypothetical protein